MSALGRFSMVVALLAGVGLAASGCGGSGGPTRYRVSGNVTFKGQPVPAGRITFEPDTAKNNSGPAGYAEIKDGRYETPADKGTVGGPHQVRIVGFDGRPVGESPDGAPLFAEYRTAADLPPGDATQDFDVPAAPR